MASPRGRSRRFAGSLGCPLKGYALSVPLSPPAARANLLIHSALSAIIGSTRLARRAGIQQARKAIVRSVQATNVKVIGSEALTPQRKLFRLSLIHISEPTRPY